MKCGNIISGHHGHRHTRTHTHRVTHTPIHTLIVTLTIRPVPRGLSAGDDSTDRLRGVVLLAGRGDKFDMVLPRGDTEGEVAAAECSRASCCHLGSSAMKPLHARTCTCIRKNKVKERSG